MKVALHHPLLCISVCIYIKIKWYHYFFKYIIKIKINIKCWTETNCLDDFKKLIENIKFYFIF